MQLIMMILLAISLSLDTFSLSLAMGISYPKEYLKKNKIKIPLVLAAIQFMMYLLGDLVENTVLSKLQFLNTIHFTAIVFLVLAIKLFMESRESETLDEEKYSIFKIGLLTSIDAFVIGILNLDNIFNSPIIYILILVVTFIFSYTALTIVNKLKSIEFVEKNCLIIAAVLMLFLAIMSF